MSAGDALSSDEAGEGRPLERRTLRNRQDDSQILDLLWTSCKERRGRERVGSMGRRTRESRDLSLHADI